MKRRDTMRYPGYDYAETGAYFVTIDVQDHRHLFGHVVEGEAKLTAAGRMIRETLVELPICIPSIALDTFVVMPNHVHALLFLGIGTEAPAIPLGKVVGRFKSLTTTRYIDGVNRLGRSRFNHRLWQRDFYDHIVRSDWGIERVREYIDGNPGRWQARIGDDSTTPS